MPSTERRQSLDTPSHWRDFVLGQLDEQIRKPGPDVHQGAELLRALFSDPEGIPPEHIRSAKSILKTTNLFPLSLDQEQASVDLEWQIQTGWYAPRAGYPQVELYLAEFSQGQLEAFAKTDRRSSRDPLALFMNKDLSITYPRSFVCSLQAEPRPAMTHILNGGLFTMLIQQTVQQDIVTRSYLNRKFTAERFMKYQQAASKELNGIYAKLSETMRTAAKRNRS